MDVASGSHYRQATNEKPGQGKLFAASTSQAQEGLCDRARTHSARRIRDEIRGRSSHSLPSLLRQRVRFTPFWFTTSRGPKHLDVQPSELLSASTSSMLFLFASLLRGVSRAAVDIRFHGPPRRAINYWYQTFIG
jgi:hypothetical protein